MQRPISPWAEVRWGSLYLPQAGGLGGTVLTKFRSNEKRRVIHVSRDRAGGVRRVHVRELPAPPLPESSDPWQGLCIGLLERWGWESSILIVELIS